jgi:cytochrome P450
MAQVTTNPPSRRAPGPRGHFLLGNANDFQRDPLRFFLDITQAYGDIVQFRFLNRSVFFIHHPDGVKHVLQENHQNYDRDNPFWHRLKLFLGESLLTTDGKSWLQQRRLMQPAFHRQRISSFGTLITEAAVTMRSQWHDSVESGEPLDIAVEMMRLTQRIIGQALFSIDLSNETDAVGQAIATANRLFSYYFYAPFVAMGIPTPRNLRFRAAIRQLDEVVQNMINERRQQETDDLLSMLLQARDAETGQGMSDRQLRDEVLTLLAAGHETTANALTWTWYLLSQHPEVEHRLHTELDSVLAGRSPELEDLAQLPYTRMVTEEAMRLYPPAWAMSRNALQDDEIAGYPIPARSIVLVSPYMTHRHPAFWENPEVFDPERFTPERSSGRPRYAYFPFGGGPHLCIGNTFAIMEVPLILATLAQQYQLCLVPGHPVEPMGAITLVPRYGLRMTLHRR